LSGKSTDYLEKKKILLSISGLCVVFVRFTFALGSKTSVPPPRFGSGTLWGIIRAAGD
jgi:hypothetical protein